MKVIPEQTVGQTFIPGFFENLLQLDQETFIVAFIPKYLSSFNPSGNYMV